jgi:Uma2 family endonuclease
MWSDVMSPIPKRLLTPEEYLAQERRASFKSEYYRGEVFAMAGAKYPHNRVRENLSRLIGNALEGTTCFPLGTDQRVHVPATTLYTYPDIVIVCGKPEFQDNNDDVLLNPRVIIEVLSDSTSKYDRGGKFKLYQKLVSLQEYILVEQEEARVECFAKQSDHQWLLSTYNGLDQTMLITCLKLSIPLAKIYEGVELIRSDEQTP